MIENGPFLSCPHRIMRPFQVLGDDLRGSRTTAATCSSLLPASSHCFVVLRRNVEFSDFVFGQAANLPPCRVRRDFDHELTLPEVQQSQPFVVLEGVTQVGIVNYRKPWRIETKIILAFSPKKL